MENILNNSLRYAVLNNVHYSILNDKIKETPCYQKGEFLLDAKTHKLLPTLTKEGFDKIAKLNPQWDEDCYTFKALKEKRCPRKMVSLQHASNNYADLCSIVLNERKNPKVKKELITDYLGEDTYTKLMDPMITPQERKDIATQIKEQADKFASTYLKLSKDPTLKDLKWVGSKTDQWKGMTLLSIQKNKEKGVVSSLQEPTGYGIFNIKDISKIEGDREFPMCAGCHNYSKFVVRLSDIKKLCKAHILQEKEPTI